MNFIRTPLARVKVAFFILALLVQASHAALTAEALDSLKQEALSIYAATKVMHEDRKEMYEDIQKSLPTLGTEALIQLCLQHTHKKVNPEQAKRGMEMSCSNSIKISQQNLEILSSNEERLETADLSGVSELFKDLLREIPSYLKNRKSKIGDIPSTVPGMMQEENPHRLRLAEKSRIDRWNEAALLRLFSKALAPEDLSDSFALLLSDKIFGGYFTILKAYVLDLVESPPLPDHWQLQETKDSRTSTLREKVKKKALLTGPLSPLDEEESQAQQALEAYEKQPAPLTEAALQEELEAERKEEAKRTKKKEKAARQRAKKKAAKLLDAADVEANASSADLVVEEALGVPPTLSIPSPKGKDRARKQKHQEVDGIDEVTVEGQIEIDEVTAEDQIEIDEAMALAQAEWDRPQQAQDAQLADEEEEIAPSFHISAKFQPLMTHFWTAPKMEWRDFKKLFTSKGGIEFKIKPNGGSIRKFIYPESLQSTTGRRSFLVHEPHGVFSTVGPRTLSAVRRWMWEDFGWTAEMFDD